MNEKQFAANRANEQSIRAAAEQAADPRVDLAVLRTQLALDRTQLAWVRTAFTFITAGLAIDKAAEVLHEARVVAGTNWVTGGLAIGLTLASVSTLFLLISTFLYFQQAQAFALFKAPNHPEYLWPCSSPYSSFFLAAPFP